MKQSVPCDKGESDMEGGNNCLTGKHAGKNCSRGVCLACKGLPLDIKPESVPQPPRQPCGNCRGIG